MKLAPIKIILFFLICSSFLLMHQFHITNLIINYNKESESFQYTFNVFINDLEKALEKDEKKLFIGTELEKKKVDSLIFDYFNKSLNFVVNNNKIRINFVGKESSEDLSSLHLYFESDRIPLSENSKIELYNDLLTEVFEDQQNIIRFNVNNINKNYFLLNNFTKTKTFTYSFNE